MSMKTVELLRRVLVYGLLIAGSIVFIMPLAWLLSTSLKGDTGLFQIPPQWIPETFHWDNYRKAVETFPFFRYTLNTVFITVMSMIGAMLSSSYVAYAFAKLRWPGRDVWFVIFLATMMLPGQVTMIPLFILFKKLGWVDTYLPLIVPYYFGSAFYIFLMRQFFLTIPKDLSEAAKMDGSSELYTWWRIFLPLSMPALATLGIFTFTLTWNDFLGPLIYLSNPDDFTLALGLRGFQQQYGTRWNVMMAASLLVMLPTLVLFFFFQRYFIEGVTLTGVKG
ncbi:MAG: sugar ABC transporter ATP-binding protein [Thermobacillus sp. ZCTH02-B1]|uniref:carbohydrate ABC transporter permease n=1 Tax=Thermobacillus sp. ZCTH02-B1 TaxID=1858795 RepID=UPI000B559168|nr:carbohydrate ABC transporter permease [Thermobacillus sp. ZCTH02-B1]OUM97296.1 MAG: sugar ABC transporter ATP-binding protein [Thermobacillus sp. ZCTH02-B1]